MISSLVLSESGGAHGVAILDSTSTDGTDLGHSVRHREHQQ